MRKTFASRALGLLPLLLIIGPSCSLVYDLSPDQCGSNDDCTAHFGSGYTCDSGICVCHDQSVCGSKPGTGGMNTGGTSAVGGSSGTAAVGGDAGAFNEGGASNTGATGGTTGGTGASGGAGGTGAKGGKGGTGAGGTTGGTMGDAGMAGAPPPPPECDTHADCATKYKSSFSADPRACVDHQCVELLTDDCPFTLPISDEGKYELLKTSDAIILGAFSSVVNGSSSHIITHNFDLAVQEVHNTIRGVQRGTTQSHEIMMVVCDGFHYASKEDLLAPAKHLIEDLKIPGIIGTLPVEDQQYVVQQLGLDNGVFFMMPLYSDQLLINLADSGLVWHMLSGADSLGVSYQPLLDMVTDHLKNLGTLGDTEDLRVTLVTGRDEPLLAGLGDYFTKHVTFNNNLAKDNVTGGTGVPGTFTSRDTTSDVTDKNFDQTQVIQDVVASTPHVIVGATSGEMLAHIIPGIESTWDAATMDGTHPDGLDRPFYILSPLDYNQKSAMTTLLNGDTSAMDGKVPLRERILGINWQAAEDPSVYNDYLLRYQQAWTTNAAGYENFYDSAYYLMYAVAGAKGPLTGTAIVSGMQRLTSGSQSYSVGPDDMVTATSLLNNASTTTFKLIGAEGPPAWTPDGARTDPSSVWCVKPDKTYAADVLRYKTGSPATLEGTGVSTPCGFTFP